MKSFRWLTLGALLLAGMVAGGASVRAHCDGLDGPVVAAARKALEGGDVRLALVWVQPDADAEIRAAFEAARSIRPLSAPAKALADTFFFETLVRVHRAGEGATYTGLKPAGRDLGPAIPAADRALATGSADELVKLITAAVETGIREHFAHAKAASTYEARDVAAGREYVKAYVEYVHYVERLYDAAKGPAHGHFDGSTTR